MTRTSKKRLAERKPVRASDCPSAIFARAVGAPQIRRIEILPLHLHHDAVDGAVPEHRQSSEFAGARFEEGRAGPGRERMRGGEEGGHLLIGQRERPRR